MLDLTNADKYVRTPVTVREGRDLIGRPAWGNEVWGTYEVTPGNGSAPYTVTSQGSYDSSLVRSYEHENLYEQELNVDEIYGALKLRKADGSFLTTGDTYTLTALWRSQTPGDPRRHTGTEFLPQSQTVRDVMPPVPATPDRNLIRNWETALSGTWVADEEGDEPVSVAAFKRPNGAGNATQLTGTWTLTGSGTGSGTWTFDLDPGQLDPNDIISIVLTDALGNANPFNMTPLRDRMLPPAGIIIVAGDGVPYMVHYHYEGVEDISLRFLGSVPAGGGYASMGAGANNFPDQPRLGYMLDRIEPATPVWVEDGPSFTEIKVHYVIDPKITANIRVRYHFRADPLGSTYTLNAAFDKTLTPHILGNVTRADVLLADPPPGYILDARDIEVSGASVPGSAQSLDGRTINVYYTTTLQEVSIGKTVGGPGGEEDRDFSFSMVFYNENGTPLAGYTMFYARFDASGEQVSGNLASWTTGTGANAGRINFTLKHGEQIVFTEARLSPPNDEGEQEWIYTPHLRSDRRVQFIETPVTEYDTYFEDSALGTDEIGNDTGVRVIENADRDFEFFNEKQLPPPTGLAAAGMPMFGVAIVVAVIGATVGGRFFKRPQEEEVLSDL